MPPPVKMPIRAVQAAYETGDESIRAIARRFGVSDRAIRKHAKGKGWTRSHDATGLRPLTERDREAMLVTAADLARLTSGAPVWRR